MKKRPHRNVIVSLQGHSAMMAEVRHSGLGTKKRNALRKGHAAITGGKDEIAEYLRRRESLAKQVVQEAE